MMIRDGNFPGLLKTLGDLGVAGDRALFGHWIRGVRAPADGKAGQKTLADHGMKCVSAHFSMRELREKQDASIAWAKDVGITQMITATLGGGNTPTMDDVKKAADEYNKIAAVAAKAGIQQGLHNEGFELSEVDGRRTYDILFELLDPKLVKFQFQMSTIAYGFVAARVLHEVPGPVHLDAPAGRGPERDSAPTAARCAGPRRRRRGRGRGVATSVGKGSIDWVKTFQAAKVAGVKNYFVEQNMDLTKESVAFLKTLKV